MKTAHVHHAYIFITFMQAKTAIIEILQDWIKNLLQARDKIDMAFLYYTYKPTPMQKVRKKKDTNKNQQFTSYMYTKVRLERHIHKQQTISR